MVGVGSKGAKLATKRKSSWKIFGLAAFLLAVSMAAALEVMVFFPRRPAHGFGIVHRIEVQKGIGSSGLVDKLVREKLTVSPLRFGLWLRVSRGMKFLKAGIFDLSDNLTPMEIMAALSGRASDKGIKVVIPEGFTLSRIAAALDDAEVASGKEFLKAATDKSLVRKLGFSGSTFEGFLFPDTYYFAPAAKPEAVIRDMTDNFRRQLKQAGILEDAKLKDTVILASIVQAEAKVGSEMPSIAGVYVNRMKSPDHPSRLLQADPTVSYGCEQFVVPRADSCLTFKGTLGRKQLDDTANPYNTYQHPGLPPGPISAPGLRALRAAAHPKSVPFLYFVAAASGDGTHVFSATYEEHLKAVRALRSDPDLDSATD
jgi:UPF0755 protein